MARVIELFQNVRKMLEVWHTGRIALLFAFTIQLSVSSAAFFLFQAQAADDYGISFYMFISALACVIHTLNIERNMDKISTLFGNFEEFIDTRQFW